MQSQKVFPYQEDFSLALLTNESNDELTVLIPKSECMVVGGRDEPCFENSLNTSQTIPVEQTI